MTPERWKRTEELYHAARARPAGERAAFLAEACRDDASLARDVESLLNEPESSDGFFAQPALMMAAPVVTNPPHASMAGRILGGYHLEALLGVGGMGEVYRARDARLGRDVAIKILPHAFTANADRLARFEREARMLAALNHPNICAIYGLEEANEIRFLILELAEGETLAERIDRGGLAMPEAFAIARQIAEALEVAHEKGIVHRDLKPANIKITPDGVVKVLDFGLAKAGTADASGPDLTRSPTLSLGGTEEGVILGTAGYMSPEQARGKLVDKRADIWAFGCVLYEMLTGRDTFAGDTVADTIGKILEREPDWSALPAATPIPIRRLLLRCLTKDPKLRLRDIGEARIELDAVHDVPPGAYDVSVTSAPAKTGRTWLPWVALIALATAFTVWEARRPATTSQENPLADAKFTPFTNFEGAELDAAISPDGNFVAFLADRNGPFHVFLSRVGSGRFDDLTPGLPDQRNPALQRSVGFSGDGSEIWINGTAGIRLRLVPLLGGAPRVFLAEHTVNVAWSHDGKRLAYFTYDAGDPFFVADGTGGNAHQILVTTAGEHHHYPSWSPDGQWIYYANGRQDVMEFDVWRLPSAGGTPERLTHHNSEVRYVTAISAGTVLYVAADEDRSGPWLWALDVERKITRRVSVGLERYLSVAASGDGHRLVATVVATSTAALWSVPILDRLVEEREVTSYPLSTVRALGPRFGGDSLFYLSSSGVGDGLWRLQGVKAAEIWKASDGTLLKPPAVSPRGDRVAIVLRSGGKQHLALVSADGADHRSLTHAIDVRGTAAWSPDAKWIVTGGKDSSGFGLFMIPVDGGDPVQLVAGPAFDPAWSPDGRVIVYIGTQGANGPLLAVRPDRSVVNLPPIRVPFSGGGRWRFLPNGTGLVYMQGSLGSYDFWLLDLTTNKMRQLTQLSSPASIDTFDITPDGTHIVFDRVRENSDIRLIDLPK